MNSSGAIKTTSLRVGQLSGSTQTGAWNPNEWVPTIIKSGIKLGCLPIRDEVQNRKTFDVFPLTMFIDCVVDSNWYCGSHHYRVHTLGCTLWCYEHCAPTPSPVEWRILYHLINPYVWLRGQYWACALQRLVLSVGATDACTDPEWSWKYCELLSLRFLAWRWKLSLLQPGLKILRFLHDLDKRSANGSSTPVEFLTDRARLNSATFNNAPVLGAQQVRDWLLYWKRIGYIWLAFRSFDHH